MTTWIMLILALFFAAAATFLRDFRRSVLSLWLTGLFLGGVFLSLHYELLAIAQWVLSTLTAIAFVFHGVLFGEFGGRKSDAARKGPLGYLLPILAGVGFVALMAAGGLSRLTDTQKPFSSPEGSFQETGKAIADEAFLSAEILGVTLFLIIVGAGVIARAEGKEK